MEVNELTNLIIKENQTLPLDANMYLDSTANMRTLSAWNRTCYYLILYSIGLVKLMRPDEIIISFIISIVGIIFIINANYQYNQNNINIRNNEYKIHTLPIFMFSLTLFTLINIIFFLFLFK